jgi:hypothetical protein
MQTRRTWALSHPGGDNLSQGAGYGESQGDHIDNGIQRVCDLSGPAAAVGYRQIPDVSIVTGTFCFGFTLGNFIRQGLGL